MSDKKEEKKKVVKTKVASEATKKKAAAKTNSGTKKVTPKKKTTTTTKKSIPNKAKVVNKTKAPKPEVVQKEPIVVNEEVSNEVKIEKKVEIKTNETKNQPKNTITTIIIILVIVFIIAYIYSWYRVKNQEKLADSYLLSSTTISLEIKNLDEVNQILTEAPNEYFVLISYTNNEDTYELEKGLKEIIDTYALADRFYYLDVTDIIKEDNYLERINNAFNTNKITKVPVILYYKDGVIADSGVVLRNDDNPINAGDFQKLLDIYGYEKEGL